nr:LPXTG cell wall anchor domain-containing protein [Myxococcus sp. MH1]
MSTSSKHAVWMCALLALPALAHEGESHGGPVVSSGVRDAQHVLAATGDVFEVVLKHPEHSETPKTQVRIWVAETETNAPVSGAQVELTLTGSTVQKLPARMLSAGVYETEALLEPETEWAAVVTVTRGNDVDVLALGTVHLEDDHDTSGATGATEGWRWGAVGGASLLAVVGAWWTSRRKKVRT